MSEIDNTQVATDTPAASEQVSTPAPAEQTSQPTAGTDDTEARARAMGWVAKDEFRGPAENWRDAAEFVRRGEEELPVLRERNRDMARKLTDIEARILSSEQTYKQQLANIERMNTIALNRQRDQIVASYEQAMRGAAESGDISRYDQLRQDYGISLHQFDQQIRQPQQRQPQEQPEVAEWKSRNPWFDDPELNVAAQLEHMRLQREKPNLSLRENLAETTRAVHARYPDRFGIAKAAAGAVEGGSRIPASMARGKGVSDLPSDARRIGERFVREGLFKSIDEYAREYHADNP